MAFLSEADLQAVSAAIRAAESRTTGEIVTVVAERADSYSVVTLAAPALCALVLPGLVAPFARLVAAGDLFLVQLALFAALYGLLLIPPIRRLVVPARVQRSAAGRLAREQFFVRSLHVTHERTGVLIFVSVAERYVEILADAGIDAKVPQAEWQSTVDAFVAEVRSGRVADGFVTAIGQVGERLATHFPATPTPNELPDHLFVI
jgi:putative membrane protein